MYRKSQASIINILSILCLVTVINTVIFSQFYTTPVFKRTINSKIGTTLKVEVYDPEGNLKDTRYKDNDLVLTNFKNWLVGMFTGVLNEGAYVTTSLLDDGNNARTINVRAPLYNSILNTWADTSAGAGNKGGYLGIGIGDGAGSATAPAVGDYALQSKYGSYIVTTSSTWDVNTGNIAVVGTFTATSSVTITEACLLVQWIPSSGTTSYSILMTRDTFAGIAVNNADTIVLTVTIALSTVDFNRNFGAMLAGVFVNYADNGGATVTTYRVDTGAAVNFYVYRGSTGGTYCNYGSSAATDALKVHYGGSAKMAVGTSGLTSTRTMTAVQNPSYTTIPQWFKVTPDPEIVSGTILIQGDVLCQADITIREVALYYMMADTANALYCIMLWRSTFAAVDVPRNTPIHIEFTITFT